MDRLQQAPSTSPPNPPNFAFVTNVRALVGEMSFQLTPRYLLRKATDDEVVLIRNTFLTAGVVTTLPTLPLMWEWKWGDKSVTHEDDSKKWRYHVISFDGPNDTDLYDLLAACRIASTEIECACVFLGFHTGSKYVFGHMMQPAWLKHDLDVLFTESHLFVDFNASHASAISDLYHLYSVHNHELIDLTFAVSSLNSMTTLHPSSKFRALASFAILESLLAHQPDPTDQYQSITRQIKTKLALLEHRWSPPTDYSALGKMSPDKIWSALYAYRSAIAHGGKTDFKGKQQHLISPGHVNGFLRQVVKAVVRHTLLEPQLISDLREC